MRNIMGRTTLALCLMACSGMGWSSAIRTVSEQVQSLLREQAQAAFPDARIAVDVAPLDARLTLSDCSELTLTPRTRQVHGRIPVAVQCRAPSAWSVFLTGDVSVVMPVVVSRAAIARGTVLGSADLALEPRDLSALRNQYLTSIERAAGLETRSPLGAAEVVYATQLKEPLAVRRGERVTIVATRGAVQINVQGEALQSGTAGSQIRVRNLQSERIVHAWVRAQGLVATSP